MKLCLRCNQYFEDSIDSCPKDSITLEYVGKDPLIGALVNDRYIVESVIGKGSSGIVYKALRLQHGEVSVALKVLHSYLSATNNSLDHFLRESRAASKLRNPHIITIWDSGLTDDGQPYFVMDYLEGMTLGKLIREKGALPPQRVLSIVKQICEALSEAHKQGIIHRDLKPENIMLQEVDSGNDYVKVLDFGIADSPQDLKPQLEPIKFVAGSPAYMSPEQCQGFELDPRSDIYSLGIVVFEMLTGKRPFKGEEHVSMMFLHVSRPPLLLSEAAPELNFPQAADQVIAAALAKIPDQRQTSVEDFWLEIENAFTNYEEDQAKQLSLPRQILKSNRSPQLSEIQSSDVETQTLASESSVSNEQAVELAPTQQFGAGLPIKRALERTFQNIKAATSPLNRLDLDLAPAANDPHVILAQNKFSQPAPMNQPNLAHNPEDHHTINLESAPDSPNTLHKKDVSSILEKLIETVAGEVSHKASGTNFIAREASRKASGTNFPAGEASHKTSGTNFVSGEASHKTSGTNFVSGEASHKTSGTNFVSGEASHKTSGTNFVGGEASHKTSGTNFVGGETSPKTQPGISSFSAETSPKPQSGISSFSGDPAAETADLIIPNNPHTPGTLHQPKQNLPQSHPVNDIEQNFNQNKTYVDSAQQSLLDQNQSSQNSRLYSLSDPPIVEKTESNLSKLQMIIVLMLSSIFAFVVCGAINVALHQQSTSSIKMSTQPDSDVEKVTTTSASKNGKKSDSPEDKN
jgi:serine/threonine protein kinase